MKGLRSILFVLLVPLVISGCATTKGKIGTCEIIGGVAGGTTGAIVAENAIWGIPGIAVGAILGHVLCRGGDADGDKVSDTQDSCPNTPAGASVDKNGCPDSDKDGVPDNNDKCPNTERGPVYKNGCPVDSDKDGVADYRDQCPRTLPRTKVNSEGCVACRETLVNLQNKIYFNFAECGLKFDTAQAMNNLAKALKGTDTRIHIEGHTDDIGPYENNLTLSKCRANAVKDHLVAQGVVADNITTEGKGENFPIASNEMETGRAKNRRVKIVSVCK